VRGAELGRLDKLDRLDRLDTGYWIFAETNST